MIKGIYHHYTYAGARTFYLRGNILSFTNTEGFNEECSPDVHHYDEEAPSNFMDKANIQYS